MRGNSKIIRIMLLGIGILLALSQYAFSQFVDGPFGSARAVGEGGGFTATIDNSNSVFYNPSCVEFDSDQNFLLGYDQGTENAQGYVFSYTKRLSGMDVIGVGVDNNGISGGDFGVMALSYARKLNDQFTLGISANRHYCNVEPFSGEYLGGDLGLAYHLTDTITLGLNCENLAKTNFTTKTGSEEVVLTRIRFGVSFIQEGLFVDRIDIDMMNSRDECYNSLGMGMGLSLKIFGLIIWKGYSYLQQEVTPAWDYDKYIHSNTSRSGPWEEALGVGWPVSKELMIEFTSEDKGNSAFSVRYVI